MRRAASAIAVFLAAGCSAAPIDVAHLNPSLFGSDLLAHWTFDEGSGSTLTDVTGHGHNGVVTGGAWINGGQFGGALDFSQPGSEVAVPAFPNAGRSWTVSLWANVSASQMATPDFLTLVSTEVPLATGTTAGGWEANVAPMPDGMHLHFGYWVGPGVADYDFADCNCLLPGRWTHFAAVVDGDTRTLAIYVGGVRKQVVGIRALIAPGSSTLYMARWAFDPTTRLYTGGLDDVAIFARALASEEIRRLTAAPAPNPS